MHNIGSTQTEFAGETTGFEAEQFEYNENGKVYETFEQGGEVYEGVLSPEAEAELATEFMEIATEAELDRFLGGLIRKVGRAVGGVIRSPLGRAVGGMLKGVARLDRLAEDALKLSGGFYQAPPVVCYLDSSHGAAIRRARTKLPAGGRNPCAVIRVPRERIVGSGIAASVVHEAAHQGSALLGLVPSLRAAIEEARQADPAREEGWRLWSQWISEIVCDFWALARLGIAATLGLMSGVSHDNRRPLGFELPPSTGGLPCPD